MRYITPYILEDLKNKMVFIGGSRQVGKMILVKALLQEQKMPGRYFNWDYDEDRQDILLKKWSAADKLLVFDELHKYPRWKNWIKGLYDVESELHNFLVTGSARLRILLMVNTHSDPS